MGCQILEPVLVIEGTWAWLLKAVSSNTNVGFLDDISGKEPACNAGDPGSVPG